VVLVLLAGSCLAQPVDKAAFDSYITPYVRSGNFSGNVLIEKNGKALFAKSYGFADREQQLPNSTNTRLHIASVSMGFTAAAVLRLVDQGSLELGTHVSEVILGIPGGEKIAIRDLLEERSGLPDINELPDYSNILQEHQTAQNLIDKIKGHPLLFEPGTKFLHEEHSAYNLLALIVEKKTGLTFGAAIERLVFRPTGLSRSSIDDDGKPSPEAAKGYQPKGVDGLEPATAIHWSAKTGNASVVTTADDESRFVRAIFAGDFLSKTSRDAVAGASPRVGYGWFRSPSDRYHQMTYYMNGRAPGFASFVLHLPQEKMTVVVFSNIYSSATTTIGNDLAAIALGLPYQGFHPDQKLSAEQLRRSTGEFQFGDDFYQKNAKVRLAADGTELSLHWPSGDISPLIWLGGDRFMDRAYWEPVTVERGADGLTNALVYDRFRGSAIRPK